VLILMLMNYVTYYQKKREHVLRVVASDSENSLLMSTTKVVVNVLNVDDEPTLFQSSTYFLKGTS
jgi:hypothetical protein